MNDQLHVVNLETCNGDGICAEVCPENALELLNEKAATVESRAGSCIYCGQCVAVCPTESLQMPKLEMEDFRRLHKRPFGYDEFHEFLRLRRSVRVFKDRPVDRDAVDKILETAATAPMGFPPHTTEVVVIDDRSKGLRERYGIPKDNRKGARHCFADLLKSGWRLQCHVQGANSRKVGPAMSTTGSVAGCCPSPMRNWPRPSFNSSGVWCQETAPRSSDGACLETTTISSFGKARSLFHGQ